MLNKISPEENVLRLEIIALEKKIELMQQLASTSGFFEYYFKLISKKPNRREAFESTNETYFELFKKYRYSNYDTFRQVISVNYKKTKTK